MTIDLAPEWEQVLRAEAARRGQEAPQYAAILVQERLRAAREADPAYLMTLPREEQDRILTAQAEAAAPLYEADLALPPHERELTAFTALDGVDPILEPSDYLRGSLRSENDEQPRAAH